MHIFVVEFSVGIPKDLFAIEASSHDNAKKVECLCHFLIVVKPSGEVATFNKKSDGWQ